MAWSGLKAGTPPRPGRNRLPLDLPIMPDTDAMDDLIFAAHYLAIRRCWAEPVVVTIDMRDGTKAVIPLPSLELQKLLAQQRKATKQPASNTAPRRPS